MAKKKYFVGQNIKFPKDVNSPLSSVKNRSVKLSNWVVENIEKEKLTNVSFVTLKKGKNTYYSLPVYMLDDIMEYIKVNY